jgi:hypothetical protein
MVGKLLRIQGGNDWKYSHMVGKSLTWSENYSGWKATNSNMVGNFPQGVRKGVPSHRTFSLSHPSYRREFPIPFSISAATWVQSVFVFLWCDQESGGPCWLLNLSWMGTQRAQMKGVLRWLVRWACGAGTQDFCPALAALVGPVQNFFYTPYTISINLF